MELLTITVYSYLHIIVDKHINNNQQHSFLFLLILNFDEFRVYITTVIVPRLHWKALFNNILPSVRVRVRVRVRVSSFIVTQLCLYIYYSFISVSIKYVHVQNEEHGDFFTLLSGQIYFPILFCKSINFNL